jgi:hypothetical protein
VTLGPPQADMQIYLLDESIVNPLHLYYTPTDRTSRVDCLQRPLHS